MIARACIALSGLSVAATSQAQTWTWLADVEHPVLDPSKGVTTQTITLSVFMEFDAQYLYFNAAVFDTIGIFKADVGSIVDWQVLNHLDDLTGDLTTTDGVSLFNTHAGQLFPFQFWTSGNPVDVLEFTWEPIKAGAYEVKYATETELAAVWAGETEDAVRPYFADIIHEVSFGWTVIPTPPTFAGGACLALLLAIRRRRA